MVGKTGPFFPMIGKIFHAFSNDWKKFSRKQYHQQRPQTGKRKPIKNACFPQSHIQPHAWTPHYPEAPPCFFRSFRVTSGGAASCRAMADGERKNDSRQVRQGRQGIGRRKGGKNSRGAAEARRAWRTLLHKRTKRKQKGRLECGRKVNIENHENRFADMERREGCGWDFGAASFFAFYSFQALLRHLFIVLDFHHLARHNMPQSDASPCPQPSEPPA